jgi:hypothetical protein
MRAVMTRGIPNAIAFAEGATTVRANRSQWRTRRNMQAGGFVSIQREQEEC